MAKIKSYTDLEQSKKLAEILPLESADMRYKEYTSSLDYSSKHCDVPSIGFPYSKDVPCWSLAALLGILPILDNRSPELSKTFDRKYRVVYAVYHSTAYEKVVYTENFDNPIDACVAMIECLHELDLL